MVVVVRLTLRYAQRGGRRFQVARQAAAYPDRPRRNAVIRIASHAGRDSGASDHLQGRMASASGNPRHESGRRRREAAYISTRRGRGSNPRRWVSAAPLIFDLVPFHSGTSRSKAPGDTAWTPQLEGENPIGGETLHEVSGYLTGNSVPGTDAALPSAGITGDSATDVHRVDIPRVSGMGENLAQGACHSPGIGIPPASPNRVWTARPARESQRGWRSAHQPGLSAPAP